MGLEIDQVFSIWCDAENCAAHTDTHETPQEAEEEARSRGFVEEKLPGYRSLWYCAKHAVRKEDPST